MPRILWSRWLRAAGQHGLVGRFCRPFLHGAETPIIQILPDDIPQLRDCAADLCGGFSRLATLVRGILAFEGGDIHRSRNLIYVRTDARQGCQDRRKFLPFEATPLWAARYVGAYQTANPCGWRHTFLMGCLTDCLALILGEADVKIV